MAQRRMFSKKIADTDLFLDMPLSTQALYFHLNLHADDDGFVSSPQKIKKTIGCSNDDFKLLSAKKFIIPFESGICVIKDWKIHNYIKKDRYTETIYLEEKKHISTNENGSYNLNVSKMYPKCIQNVSKMDTQVRLGKVSIDICTEFEQLWELYPRKLGKSKALKQYTNTVKTEQNKTDIRKALENYLKDIKEQKTEPQYIQYGSTWFNNWKDWVEYAPVQTKPKMKML